MLDYFRIGATVNVCEDDISRLGFLGQIANIGGLGAGETEGAHLFGSELEDGAGRQFRPGKASSSRSQDDGCYPSAELLIDNRSDQRAELRLAELNTVRTHPLNDGGQDRIGLLQMSDRFTHGTDRNSRIYHY